ncbi:AAA family ATPase [Dolichospermum sp. ST_sed9]|nr:AAA family ATPase [Dolichospermum sp. ST_sed9]
MISFGDTFAKVKQCFEKPDIESGLKPNLKSVTIIRDVYGKIRLFLEPKKITEDDGSQKSIKLNSSDINKLKQYLNAELGSYYDNDIWCPEPEGKQDGYKALINVITTKRIPAEWDDENISPRWHILERHIAKHTWTNGNSGNPPWEIEKVDQGDKPAIITFFSFKGGVGRTTALVATALNLARNGHRVAIVDLDLEAPGLSSIFSPDNPKPFGVIDYLLEKKIQSNNWSLRDHILPINDPLLIGDLGEELYLLSAGTVDNNYLEKLARLDFQNLIDHQLPETFKEMLEEIERDKGLLDFILLDSRAGFHDIGGLALTDLSHAAVIFGRQSRQSWAGLTHVIRRLSRRLASEGQLPVVLAHAMSPSVRETARYSEYEKFNLEAYQIFAEDYYYTEEQVPNLGDEEAPFTSVRLPLQDGLQGDISLFSRDESDGEIIRLQDLINLMTNEDYQKLAKRLCLRLNKSFNKIEEEII